jgi:hypothetical protein
MMWLIKTSRNGVVPANRWRTAPRLRHSTSGTESKASVMRCSAWAYTLAGTSHVTGHADVAPNRPTGRNWLEEQPIIYALRTG